MKTEVVALILAGGKGTRFWPKSRENMPKQLLPLFGEKTILEDIFETIKAIVENDNIFISTSESLEEKIKNLLPKLKPENIIPEPVGRNTAPSIGLSTFIIRKIYGDAVIVVLPGDHYIGDKKRFLQTVKTAIKFASSTNKIITLGIEPSYPETGYGYILKGDKIKVGNGKWEMGNGKLYDIYKVKSFTEKPGKKTAEEFVTSGNYLWNSGMFVWRASTILSAYEKYAPVIYEKLKIIDDAIKNRKWEVL